MRCIAHSFAFIVLASAYPTTVWAGTSDFDGDGRDELVICVPLENLGAVDNAGAVHVLRGSSGGVKASGDQFWHQNVDGVSDSAAGLETFGWATASGDFDDDGRDDLAIGVPSEMVAGYADSGAVHVLYGSNNGLSASGDQFWHRDKSGVGGTAEADGYFGNALAVGDFDGDGFDDLAIGSPFDDVSGFVDAGSVTILYGSNSGLTADGDQRISQNTTGVLDDAETGDLFGMYLEAGDFDNDGRDDLVIAVAFENIDGVVDAGAVHVLYGSNSGLSTNGDQFWHQNSTGVLDECEPRDQFGWYLAVGDFDDDGRDDLAVGVGNENILAIANAGAVNVLYGSSSGLTASGDQFWHQDSDGVRNLAETNDYFGYRVAAGDFDDDGRDDLVIGVMRQEVDVYTDAGAVAVLYGSSSGLTADGDDFIHQDTSGVVGNAAAETFLGLGLFIGDFDGDGRDDIAAAMPYADVDGVNESGSILVLYGSNSGVSTDGDQLWSQNSSGIADSAEVLDDLGYCSPG